MNISQKEEELRRSHASQKSRSPQMTPKAETASASGEMDDSFKVLDSTGVNEATGAYAQTTPGAHQAVTYRREQKTLPEHEILKENNCKDQAVLLHKAAPEFYLQQTQMWHATEKGPPLRRCPNGAKARGMKPQTHPRDYKDYYDTTPQNQSQWMHDKYIRETYAAQQTQSYCNEDTYERERPAQYLIAYRGDEGQGTCSRENYGNAMTQ